MNRKETKILVENWRNALEEKPSVENIFDIISKLEEISKQTGENVKILYSLDGDYGRVEYNVFDELVSGAIDFERVISGNNMGDFIIFETFTTTSGYGPLLYEILVEKATERGVCLMSDQESVSDSAKSVWDKYFKREDIDHKQIRGEDNSSLSKCYSKRGNLIILKKLRESNLIDFVEED